MCMCVYMHELAPAGMHLCESQRTACQWSPTIRTPAIRLRGSGLVEAPLLIEPSHWPQNVTSYLAPVTKNVCVMSGLRYWVSGE